MRLTLAIILCLAPWLAYAKPLITTSEQTLVSTCVDYNDTHERLLQICAAAIDEPGLTDRKRAEILTAHADALSWLDRYDEARRKYEAALEVDPLYADAHEGLGWSNWLEDDYVGAVASFKTSLDLSPSSDALGGFASSQLKAGQIDAHEAVTLFDAALAIEPKNRWVLRQKGWTLMGEEIFEPAREAFQAAVTLNDQDAEALEGLSLAHYHLDDDETALTYINAAISAAPNTPGYLQRRSMILLALDRPAAALRDADKFLLDRPESAIGYVRKGRALDALGRTMDALAVMKEARDRLPRYDTLDYWYAMTLSDDGRHSDAWDVMAHHLDQASGDFWDYVLLAFLSVKTDQLDAASDAVGNLQRLRSDNQYTHYWTAVTQVYAGDVDSAERRILQAIEQGMSDSLLGDFVEHMVGQGYYIRAAAFRIALNRDTFAEE